MREIKFRAWHYHKGWSKDGKPLEPGMEYDFWVSDKGKVSFPEGGWDINSIESPDSLVLMQYTGLKDKNGKEIYFDDLLQKENIIYKVIWNKTKISLQDISTGDIIDYQDNLLRIGNIYENR